MYGNILLRSIPLEGGNVSLPGDGDVWKKKKKLFDSAQFSSAQSYLFREYLAEN